MIVWDMVFKVVEGVVFFQGGFCQLWYFFDIFNSDNFFVQILIKDLYFVYKFKNVEIWRSIFGFFIESVSVIFGNILLDQF